MLAGRWPGFALGVPALISVHTMARTCEQVRVALMRGLMRMARNGRRHSASGSGASGAARRGPAVTKVAAWASTVLVLVVVAGSLFGYVKYREIWDGIHHDVVSGLGNRPPKYNNALNILVFGSDSRAGLTRQQQLALHVGEGGCGCSDTIMVVHLSPGRHRAVVLNIPRDTICLRGRARLRRPARRSRGAGPDQPDPVPGRAVMPVQDGGADHRDPYRSLHPGGVHRGGQGGR
jgi:hypothetical protein